MVFEQIFKASWMEKRPSSTFLIAGFYSIIAIISARLIFPANSGIMSVAFLAVLMSPSLNKLMEDEERIEVKQKGKFSLRRLIKDHEDIFEIFFFLFLGVFSVFFVASALFPPEYTLRLFREQLSVLGNLTGAAIQFDSLFMDILWNNLVVLIVVFALSILYGAGAILLVVWNASVWGAVFGFMFHEQVLVGGMGLVEGFVFSMMPFLPHIIIEAMSYLAVAISGGVLSKAMLREKMNSKGFHHVITDSMIFLGYALVLVILGAYVEVHVVPLLWGY